MIFFVHGYIYSQMYTYHRWDKTQASMMMFDKFGIDMLLFSKGIQTCCYLPENYPKYKNVKNSKKAAFERICWNTFAHT